MYSTLKKALVGAPKASGELAHQRLPKILALPVFSSDALSSVAYATEEILLVLVLAGGAALVLAWPIALAISLLLIVVAISYRQTIAAYPCGGGAYIVARENLGESAGLIAGASLLTDYTLTVAVSIAAGTAAATSAWPALEPYRVVIAVGFVWLITLANLRGVRESGSLFAIPTYGFVFGILTMIGLGAYKLATGQPVPPPAAAPVAGMSTIGLFLILRAFASGCTAMTGIEAIANGVQAFEPPESKNARTTLAWMAAILVAMFLGITWLARAWAVAPAEGETVLSSLGRGIFGTGTTYFGLQIATMAILVLAANTSYADFPRLSSIMAADGYMPRQFKNRGNRLVFSNGIVLLALASSLLLIAFGGRTHYLIPLYAVGVFTSFTLSQAGMVLHHLKEREPGWRRNMAINAAGALATALVLVVVTVTKFMLGAWIIIAAIPVLVTWLGLINRHYRRVERRLTDLKGGHFYQVTKDTRHTIIMPVDEVDAAVIDTIKYGRLMKPEERRAVHVDWAGDGRAGELARRWESEINKKRCLDVPLDVVESPFRDLLGPLKIYLLGMMKRQGGLVSLLFLHLSLS